MSEELKSPDAVSVCLFVWILIVYILCFVFVFVWFFTGVLHSNIYIGRGFFCALILSNYGNISWQNRKQNNKGKKKNTKLVVMKDDALDKSEILSWSAGRLSPLGVFLKLHTVPQQIPALALKAEWRVLLFAIGEMSHQVEQKGREGRVKLLS